jgi:hypothetical protein
MLPTTEVPPILRMTARHILPPSYAVPQAQLHPIPSTPTAQFKSLRQRLNKVNQQGHMPWSLINKHRGSPIIQFLIQFTHTLEDHTVNILNLDKLHTQRGSSSEFYPTYEESPETLTLIEFYPHPTLYIPKKHSTNCYLASQLCSSVPVHKNILTNKFLLLDDMSGDESTPMDDDITLQTNHKPYHPTKPANTVIKTWVTDPSISKILETFIQNLHQEQEKLREAGEDPEKTTKYIPPSSDSVLKVNQNIHFNLFRARNSDSSTPTLQLFKSFASALRNSDQFLSILPFHSSKQMLPSLSNKTQTSIAEKNKKDASIL